MQAQQRLQAALGTFKEVFPGTTFTVDLDASNRALLDGISADCMAVQVTKMEFLLATALQQMQSATDDVQRKGFKKRLDNYTANVGSMASKPWSDVIQKRFGPADCCDRRQGRTGIRS